MLITLVIIGIIAALTIPNLLQKYTEQATVKSVQKFYSNLINAYQLAVKENGPIDEWGIKEQYEDKESAEKVYEIFFKPYFKISKNCGTLNTGNCVVNVPYKSFNNQNMGYLGTVNTRYKFVLNDGSAVVFFTEATNTITNIKIFYDINSVKKPNQYGKDTFYFIVNSKNKVIPRGFPGYDGASYSFDNYCKTNGMGCTAWVIYKGNMDYLHCDGLTWNSRSCKEK